MADSGEVRIIADGNSLWAALTGAKRDASGRYPARTTEADRVDAELAAYLKATAVRQALGRNLDTAVTTSSRGEIQRWAGIAWGFGAEFEVRTVDPGEEVARARLADGRELEAECAAALARWY